MSYALGHRCFVQDSVSPPFVWDISTLYISIQCTFTKKPKVGPRKKGHSFFLLVIMVSFVAINREINAGAKTRLDKPKLNLRSPYNK